VSSGQLAPNDLIWQQGFSKWVPVSEVAGLMPGSTATTPESPPVTGSSPGPLTAVAAEAPPGTTPRPGAGLPSWTKRPVVWLVVGGGALLLGLLCCTGGVLAFLIFKGGSGERVIGTWEGQKGVSLVGKVDYRVEFKRDGRVTWSESHKDYGSSTAAGTWKVGRVEGEKYIVHVVNDSEPDRTYGWSLTFDGKDHFTLDDAPQSGLEFLPITFERKR
jgi:hypothetical protein